jgi:hypothetical protein
MPRELRVFLVSMRDELRVRGGEGGGKEKGGGNGGGGVEKNAPAGVAGAVVKRLGIGLLVDGEGERGGGGDGGVDAVDGAEGEGVGALRSVTGGRR